VTMSTTNHASTLTVKTKVEEERKPAAQAKADFRAKLTEFLVAHRWATVVPAVLPLSRAYDLYWTARHVHYRNFASSAEKHGERVRGVVQQIGEWNGRGRPGLLHTSRKSWQRVTVRPIDYEKTPGMRGIRVDLHDILEVDLKRMVVRVEPRVNMGQLTRRLLPMGVTIPVVPELDDLTVGGLILGYGIESSSHKYGLFSDTVRSAELVLANGHMVRASPQQHADLFYALPFSQGALGMLTAVELPLVPCKPYVRLTYQPVHSLDQACAVFSELATREKPPEFLDALLFGKEHGVVVFGDFADLPEGQKTNAIGRFYKPWFYQHVKSMLGRGQTQEHIPLRDYYRRYMRSLYWHGELLVPFGNHPLFRYPLGWLMPPKVSVMRLMQTERIRKFRDERNVVQDALIPLRHLRDGIELFHREFECYPLWLCAHKTFRTTPQGMIGPSLPDVESEMFVDIGAWQVPGFVKRKEVWDGRQAVRTMEAWLRSHNGYQSMYAVTEQTRAQFWQMFDRSLYEQARKKYGAEGAFMDVFDKVKRPEQA
jgi:Delta24-sterol reductase